MGDWLYHVITRLIRGERSGVGDVTGEMGLGARVGWVIRGWGGRRVRGGGGWKGKIDGVVGVGPGEIELGVGGDEMGLGGMRWGGGGGGGG